MPEPPTWGEGDASIMWVSFCVSNVESTIHSTSVTLFIQFLILDLTRLNKGFTTYTGTVTAASSWGKNLQKKNIVPGRKDRSLPTLGEMLKLTSLIAAGKECFMKQDPTDGKIFCLSLIK